MKFKFKNLIAFTLSEMMIVLLIVSVISAATVPTITQQRQKPYNVSDNNATSTENWEYDRFSGIFSAFSLKNKEHSVVIGKDTKNDSTRQTVYGSVTPAVMLTRSTDAQTRTSDKGQIMLYNSEKYVGSFGFDKNINTYMGYGSGYDRIMSNNNPNVSIGYYANGGQSSNNSAMDGTVGIGYYSMYRSLGGAYNVSIGSYAGYYATNTAKSINIGNCAGSSICEKWGYVYRERDNYPFVSDPYNYGNISIGASSGYLNYAILNNSRKSLNNNISIGYFSGDSYDATIISSQNLNSSMLNNRISIGAYAGKNTALYADTIYVGYLAGGYNLSRANIEDSNVAIGYYSGMVRDSGITGLSSCNRMVAIGSYSNNDIQQTAFNAGTVAVGSYTSAYNIGVKQLLPSIAIGYYAESSEATISIGAYAYYGGAIFSNRAVAIGRYVANGEETSSTGKNNNIYIGKYAGNNSTSSFYRRIFIGYESGACTEKSKYTSKYGSQYCTGSGTLVGYGTFTSSAGGSVMELLPYASSTIGTDTGGKFTAHSIYEGSIAVGPGYGYPGGPSFNNTILVLYASSIYAKSTTFSPFSSDRHSKENIEKSKYGIEQFRHINTYTYNFNFDNDKKPRVGLIAQEVQKYIPEAIVKSADGTLAIDFDWILYSLANAIKDVDNTLTQMKDDLIAQAKDLTRLERRVCKLETKTTKTLEKQDKMQSKLNQTKDIVNNMENK